MLFHIQQKALVSGSAGGRGFCFLGGSRRSGLQTGCPWEAKVPRLRQNRETGDLGCGILLPMGQPTALRAISCCIRRQSSSWPSRRVTGLPGTPMGSKDTVSFTYTAA